MFPHDLMYVFFCKVEVSKAPCIVHGGQCSRKATVRDGVTKVSVEGSPCILFSTTLAFIVGFSWYVFFPEMLNI